MEHYVPVEIAGLDVGIWVELFNGCHSNGIKGPQLIAWPDGKCYLDQPNIVVIMFEVIRDQIRLANDG